MLRGPFDTANPLAGHGERIGRKPHRTLISIIFFKKFVHALAKLVQSVLYDFIDFSNGISRTAAVCPHQIFGDSAARNIGRRKNLLRSFIIYSQSLHQGDENISEAAVEGFLMHDPVSVHDRNRAGKESYID